jgi:hypothetical protein
MEISEIMEIKIHIQQTKDSQYPLWEARGLILMDIGWMYFKQSFFSFLEKDNSS